MALIKNKVLLVFSSDWTAKDGKARTTFVEELFRDDVGLNDTQSIVKDVTWRNKYYKVKLDIYIDEYSESFVNWFQEFSSEQYYELHEVLAGIIIVDNDPIISKVLPNLNVPGENIFLTWCYVNVSESHDEMLGDWECINFSKVSDAVSGQEGIDRLQEIIDLHDWSSGNVPMEMLNLRNDMNQQSDEFHSLDIEALLQQIKQAKERYRDLHRKGKIEEAEMLANEVSEEYARHI